MTTTSKLFKAISLNLFTAGLMLAAGHLTEVSAQRDPFSKPGWARTREPRIGAPGNPSGTTVTRPDYSAVPTIESRIDFYKRSREAAAAAGSPIPKVTSVLTLNELSVTGIFRTPRGYAAMVEATPIKLSYTIYPGDKFFDGQLVAVEENRLVFRRVVKTGPGKFVASVENKPLRKFTEREQIQGTAPYQNTTKASDAPVQAQAAPAPAIVSPIEEMNASPAASTAAEKPKKGARKAVKVASANN